MPLTSHKLATNVKSEPGKKITYSKIKPVFNAEGHMIFSKFDFSEIGTKKHPKKFLGSKDPKKRLEELKTKKQKLQELKAAGETKKAKQLEQKDSWRAILARAAGERVLDDPELLKKTIRRKEHLKKHSAKKWEARTNKVQKDIETRQKKRQENILKRKKDKKTHKTEARAHLYFNVYYTLIPCLLLEIDPSQHSSAIPYIQHNTTHSQLLLLIKMFFIVLERRQ
ncbi:Similar to Surf6: Surfeit locus protein 6 homolog (Drosophila melanogaster) [Cotesia congregata]|uniref:Similar to Surf6: Surfeit locus protein 6 homolog (Drosophila melanogaster) n=1 Tax=Cotesia congregata TaxID=51543 RepID=A0A8J2H6P0_COTCN|nr:Similar to Surf6: Surfeit locus protein 6 homolog (Drosophila melanogaster) [Cotesia congregata]